MSVSPVDLRSWHGTCIARLFMPVDTAPLLPGIDPRAVDENRLPTQFRSAETHANERFAWIYRVEIAFAVLLTLVAVGLRVLQAHDSGGLWRDEVVSLRVATMPTLGQMWRYLEFDSYPPLFHLLLRGWHGVFGSGDFSLRVLGMLVGTSFLAMVWAASRTLGCRVPLLTLALLGLSATMIRYGDTVRAYGLGCVLALGMMAAVWRVVAVPRVEWRRVALAVLAATAAVQCLYHNAVLVFAACVGGAAVALLTRRGRMAVVALGIGVPSALSLLPYLPTILRTRQWSMLAQSRHATPAWLAQVASKATDVPLVVLGKFVWLALGVAVLLRVGWRLRPLRGTSALPDASLCRGTFAAVTLSVATGTYLAFLLVLDYSTQPWYYLPLFAVVAPCFDVVLGETRGGGLSWRMARVWLVAYLALALLSEAAYWPRRRYTNLDLTAQHLEREVHPDDLVVVNRWECAITVERYYHGAAPIISVPMIEDHAVHRYDLMKRCLSDPEILRPVKEAAATALRHGGRVWLVGGIDPADRPRRQAPAPPVKPLAPIPSDQPGVWPLEEHVESWSMQVAEFLGQRASRTRVAVPTPLEVSPLESHALSCYQGWHDPAPLAP